MKRGTLVTVAAPGDFGKPRPALVVQSDLVDDTASVTLLLLTSALQDSPNFRVTVEPSPTNGLRTTSQVQIDKLLSVARSRTGPPIGRLHEDTMLEISRRLAVFLGIAD